MARIVLLQLVITVIVAALAAILGGKGAGVSSLLGGLSCVIPNALFLFGLHASDRKLRTGTLGPFYFWELIKVLLTMVLTVAVFCMYQDVHWLAYFVNFAVALKSYIFLLSRFKNY